MVNAYFVIKAMNTKIENVHQFVAMVSKLWKSSVMILMFITMMGVINSVRLKLDLFVIQNVY